MTDAPREFLERLLSTPSPSGYERDGQAVWTEYVEPVADAVETDAYGSTVAVRHGAEDAPTVAIAGHADEIGLIVNRVDDDGFVQPGSIGGVDPTVVRGQRVTVHAADGPVAGVVGQTPIHVRQERHDEAEVTDFRIDLGAADGEAARDLVEVGDPITVSAPVTSLQDGRLAARGLDNRVGTWVAAEAFRRAVAADPDATVVAVSTVQEEITRLGAQTVGYDLDPDAVFVVDLTFTSDHPLAVPDRAPDAELGGGPVVARGSVNHPALVGALRDTAGGLDLALQFEATGTTPGTDTERFAIQGGGVPSALVSVPSRYMHTPCEVVDSADLDATADLLAAVVRGAGEEWLPP